MTGPYGPLTMKILKEIGWTLRNETTFPTVTVNGDVTGIVRPDSGNLTNSLGSSGKRLMAGSVALLSYLFSL